MKRSVLGIFAVIVFSLFGGLLLKQDASAYWINKDGKQCFAVQYSYGKAYNNEGKSVSDGNGDSQRIEAKAYSTKVVCAKVDSSGKATKATVSSSPNDTTFISDDLGVKLSVINNGKTIRSVYCKKPGKACDSGQSRVINDYDLSSGTFASIANSAVSKAPNSYGNAKKRGLKENVTNASVKSEVEKDLAKQKDSVNGANSGDPCYSINANSLGWIMCPVMRTLEGFATWLDNQVEGWLSVDTSLYNASSPTASVWEIMRNIANIIMVIILLVIIFSQLTGVGIDNYGIKKMLPRLIAMAILINLSLIVCELAIDLSNLLGTGLRNLFGSIGEGLLNEKGTADLMGNFISTMVSALLAMVAGIGAVAPVGLTVVSIGFSGGIMILVVAILSLLVVGAAVLLFFIMLGARMVIIIGCVAVAPVALAFYILPNTQDLYKKWFTAFKTALVLFPICGAVSGIGWIIRAIVLSADEIQVWMGVIGIIAPFLAFFMLPSMLRGVLGTLGKVGEALTTMGQGVRSGASTARSAVQNSERYKENMEFARKGATYDRYGRRMNRLQAKMDSGRTLSTREKSQFARMAGVRSGIEQERVSNVESLLKSGSLNVDTNDPNSMKEYHRGKLTEYNNETDARKRAAIMDEIKAVQNVMSGSSKGRDAVEANFVDAVANQETAALNGAASHLMANYGDTYKQKNRASHSMLNDLAMGDPSVADKIDSGEYVNNSVEKYTEQSLVDADDAALDNLIKNMNNGSMKVEQANQLKATAGSIARKAENGNLNVKPEVMDKVNRIRGMRVTNSVPVNVPGPGGAGAIPE